MIRKYTLNESAFAKVTRQSSYWAGFLLADGCIQHPSGKSVLSVQLDGGDAKHLDKLRDFLGSNQPTYLYPRWNFPDKTTAVVRITSRLLVESLAQWGVVPRKSLTATLCDRIANNRDAIRGLVDGDGSIHFSHTPSGLRPIISLSGTQSVCDAFMEYVRGVCPKCYAVPGKSPVSKCWQTFVSGSHAVTLAKHLYTNAPVYLERKMLAARKMMRMKIVFCDQKIMAAVNWPQAVADYADRRSFEEIASSYPGVNLDSFKQVFYRKRIELRNLLGST